MSIPRTTPLRVLGQLTPEVRAEAAAWVAKLHGSRRTSSLEAALNSWLAADPLHARAFEVATEAWELGGALSTAAVPRTFDAHRRAPHFAFLRPALAAAVLMILGISAILYLRDSAVSTATGEQRTLTLEDGTRVTLNTNTRLAIQYTPKQRHIQLESGEAFFDVAKNPQRPFVVDAGRESVMALGTSFVVRRDEREVDVTLVEGKVSVTAVTSSDSATARLRETKVLSPGQRLRVTGISPSVDQPNIEAVTAWRRGEVVLDHTSLADAIREMNRYSTVKLVAMMPATDHIQVSGIFRAGDSARFAKAVADTHRLEVVEGPGRILLRASRDERR